MAEVCALWARLIGWCVTGKLRKTWGDITVRYRRNQRAHASVTPAENFSSHRLSLNLLFDATPQRYDDAERGGIDRDRDGPRRVHSPPGVTLRLTAPTAWQSVLARVSKQPARYLSSPLVRARSRPFCLRRLRRLWTIDWTTVMCALTLKKPLISYLIWRVFPPEIVQHKRVYSKLSASLSLGLMIVSSRGSGSV